MLRSQWFALYAFLVLFTVGCASTDERHENCLDTSVFEGLPFDSDGRRVEVFSSLDESRQPMPTVTVHCCFLETELQNCIVSVSDHSPSMVKLHGFSRGDQVIISGNSKKVILVGDYARILLMGSRNEVEVVGFGNRVECSRSAHENTILAGPESATTFFDSSQRHDNMLINMILVRSE